MSTRPLSGYSSAGLDFLKRYLEALLDSAFVGARMTGCRSRWWEHVKSDIETAVELRKARVWVNGIVPANSFETPATLTDEFIWQTANYLTLLYDTLGWDQMTSTSSQPSPPELPEDRYRLQLAVASLPGPEASALLPFRTWEWILRDLAWRIYPEFLLWLAQAHAPDVDARRMVSLMRESVRRALSRESGSSAAPTLPDRWADAFSAALAAAVEKQGQDLSLPMVRIEFSHLTNLVQAILDELPAELRIPRFSLREYPVSVASNALAALLTSRADHVEISDENIAQFLTQPHRRRAAEEAHAQRLDASLRGDTYDVILPLRGTVDDMPTEALGFTIQLDFPDAPWPQPADAGAFAKFLGVHAKSADDAINECRRQLLVVISAFASVSHTPVDCEIRALDASYRSSGGHWGYVGRNSTMPLPVVTTPWSLITGDLHGVLTAGDDLAQRVQRAFIHLRRAEVSVDPDDRLDECLKVFELIGRNAPAAQSVLCVLPLCFVPRDFHDKPVPIKLKVVSEKYERWVRPWIVVQELRGKVIVHRIRVGAEWKVLERHAAWATTFARQVVLGAVLCWRWGARRPDEIIPTIQKAYRETYQFELPDPKNLRKAFAELGSGNA